ncbi:PhzF family phenazine biosynthesis protein [Deinococcus sp. KNUC1210]|uniref:PhzF family phenazine biosynthesis protein n=1 Tax=Deinococcus sp. KNUC1210 TaxID=2917691 RepID=UPI001EF0003F|nr:PhzF family phenazine biosynthesis protein [Deinococcus sp. KNUC1210]ULH16765.1 PhzF family phenazine biosynthesis protein [Deinococcus sp. KNUC1210]
MTHHSSPLTHHTPYRVYAAPHTEGGKLVSVFPAAQGDLQAQAASAGTPLSVFIEQVNEQGAQLRVFTPTRDKGESDSAAIAALHHLFAAGQIADVTDVQMAGQTYPAQLCGGEWLLRQGDVSVSDAPHAEFGALGFTPDAVQIASTGRPNLAVQLPDLASLQALTPDAEVIRQLGQATGTTGLILYTREAPRADVSFRAFGPLKGFYEDAASSNMFACLVGALSVRGLLPEHEPLVRGLQHMPGLPSRLTAQYLPQPGGASDLWIGGSAVLLEPAGLNG